MKKNHIKDGTVLCEIIDILWFFQSQSATKPFKCLDIVIIDKIGVGYVM